MSKNTFREFREFAKLTQKQLGELLLVEQSAIANYESGGRVPRPGVAKKFIELANGYGFVCSLDDVYHHVGDLPRTARAEAEAAA